MATRYQQRMAARRMTSDVERLSKQFEKEVLGLQERQAQAFVEYQRAGAERMAPFEAEMEAYRTTLLPEYERQRTDYQQALEAYQAQLEDLRANPTITKTEQVTVPRGGLAALSPFKKGALGRTKTVTETYEEPRPVPTFERQAPVAPAPPSAPALEPFQTESFKKEAEQLQSNLQRELAERRGGRLAAVRRTPRTGLMSGA